jgi:hypothetical protein
MDRTPLLTAGPSALDAPESEHPVQVERSGHGVLLAHSDCPGLYLSREAAYVLVTRILAKLGAGTVERE